MKRVGARSLKRSRGIRRPRIFMRVNRNGTHGRLTQGDALLYLRSLPSDSADLIFLDPPFNLGKQYSAKHPALDHQEEYVYQAWMGEVLRECVRVLAKGGTLYLYHIPAWALKFGSQLMASLNFVHWIAVAMKNGFMRGNRLYPAHYALLMFSKGKPAVLRRPKLRPVACRHCGGLIKDYGGYTEIIQAKGINLSDFWDDLSPVRHRHTKNRKANELPSLLFDRILQISGNRGAAFVDPFAGTGTGLLHAAAAGMIFDGCDILKSNCMLIKRRLLNASKGTRP